LSDAPFDIAVIGAGIAGASLAWHLAPHARVLLLEREPQPGCHSTGRSAAMFMESYGTVQVRAFTRASRSFYEQPPEGFADAPLLAPRGALYVGWDGQETALDTLWHELRSTGANVQRLGAHETLEGVPVLRASGLLGALAEPDAMDIDVHALLQGYLRGARRAGAELWCGATLAHAACDAGVWTVTLTDGRSVRARTLANAAGAWADDVATRCDAAPLGLQPKRRSAFTFTAPAGVDTRRWPAVVDAGERWYFKPDAGQLLGSPANADPVHAHDVVAEELDIATGIAGIEGATTLAIRRPTRTWAGLRTFAPDGDLVIGWDASRDGFFWLAGQGGYGIQSAHGAALLAATLWRGQVELPSALAQHGVQAQAMSPRRLAPCTR
jgi:D-arginine dehydrogenase